MYFVFLLNKLTEQCYWSCLKLSYLTLTAGCTALFNPAELSEISSTSASDPSLEHPQLLSSGSQRLLFKAVVPNLDYQPQRLGISILKGPTCETDNSSFTVLIFYML